MTANVGMCTVSPGGFNVIPDVADFSVDVRSPTPDGFARVDRFVRDTLARIAEEEGPGSSSRRRTEARPCSSRPGAPGRARARGGGGGGEPHAHAQRRRTRRDGARAPRPGRDAVRPEPRRGQPQPRRVHRAGAGELGARVLARACGSSYRLGPRPAAADRLAHMAALEAASARPAGRRELLREDEHGPRDGHPRQEEKEGRAKEVCPAAWRPYRQGRPRPQTLTTRMGLWTCWPSASWSAPSSS